nr:reverse transcriptase domain, reverse transcriptase zinc-binding domain protein [Tanacetum cinerariifolium]
MIYYPFMYLGLPVEKDMSKVDNWRVVIDRFLNKLSYWKSRLLSIGSRLTLVKAVLSSLPLYFLSLFGLPLKLCIFLRKFEGASSGGFKEDIKGISWIRWESVLAGKDMGGLCIGSL